MKISRAHVAHYLTTHLESDRATAISQTAAWLVSSKRSREAGYLAAAVQAALLDHDYAYARLTSAQPLTTEALERITTFIRHQTDATEVEYELKIDPTVGGGVRIELPNGRLDGTVRHHFEQLAEVGEPNA